MEQKGGLLYGSGVPDHGDRRGGDRPFCDPSFRQDCALFGPGQSRRCANCHLLGDAHGAVEPVGDALRPGSMALIGGGMGDRCGADHRPLGRDVTRCHWTLAPHDRLGPDLCHVGRVMGGNLAASVAISGGAFCDRRIGLSPVTANAFGAVP